MSDGFNLNLQNAEDHLDFEGDVDFDGQVVLGVLDGDAPDDEWLAEVAAGNVLFLAVDGNLNELAAGWAGEVKDQGGKLMHFRNFLVVAPPGVNIDTDRL